MMCAEPAQLASDQMAESSIVQEQTCLIVARKYCVHTKSRDQRTERSLAARVLACCPWNPLTVATKGFGRSAPTEHPLHRCGRAATRLRRRRPGHPPGCRSALWVGHVGGPGGALKLDQGTPGWVA